ncbi:hypothetical protein CAMRE0001_3254 [Campylobacter rectus RM3267]|uniref:Uncharacterized protein n=1 Tax=Campylobacter rectus RM3267 TaxID=553218 RepID=B9D512_CAMRE|nr:hypothetical protein CAMRE0001_3254 [Campylobacter rectus RM3267]
MLAAGNVGARLRFFSKFDNFSSGFRFWLGCFVLGFCRQKGANDANLLARLNRKKTSRRAAEDTAFDFYDRYKISKPSAQIILIYVRQI